MQYYAIAGIAIVSIIIAVVILWLIWGINLVDFTTGLGLFLVSLIPFICYWAYVKERDRRKEILASRPNIRDDRPNTLNHADDSETRRRREDDWRFFPSNYE